MVNSGQQFYPPVELYGDVKVLLIEDNQEDVRLIKTILHGMAHKEPYNVTNVPRMRDAIKTLDKKDFDLAILDLNLLDMTGLDTVVWLSHSLWRDIPIVVYAGNMDAEMQEQALACGATLCLNKEHANIFDLKLAVQYVMKEQGNA